MREMKQSRKTHYTRTVLQDSLLALFEQKPISKITIKEICERADVNRSTFYAHFTDQYDLLRQVEDEALISLERAYIGLVDNSDTSSIHTIIEGIFQYYIDNRKVFQTLLTDESNTYFRVRMVQVMYNISIKQSPTSERLSTIPKEEYFIFILNGFASLVQHWLTNETGLTAKEMTVIVTTLCLL